MKNKIFYIDFDNTLFDTKNFYNDLLKVIEETGIKKEELEKYQQEYKELYNPIKAVELINSESLRIINKFLKTIDKYLYEDTLDFLEYLKNNDNTLIMLTYGNFEYQKIKINNSGLRDYFDKIIITEKYKYLLDIDYKNGIFIDDNVRDLQGLKEKGASVIRIKRINNPHSFEELNGIDEYTSLRNYQSELHRLNN